MIFKICVKNLKRGAPGFSLIYSKFKDKNTFSGMTTYSFFGVPHTTHFFYAEKRTLFYRYLLFYNPREPLITSTSKLPAR